MWSAPGFCSIFQALILCLMLSCECFTAVQVHIALHNDSRLCAGWPWVSFWLCGCGVWLLRPLNGALCILSYYCDQMMAALSPASPSKEGKTHTHTKTNIIFYSITELHLSKLSEMITQVFYLFSLVKRWCVFHKLKYWNHRVYQSVALDAGLFPLFWMACADCMSIQMAAIWRGEEMKQLELRSS